MRQMHGRVLMLHLNSGRVLTPISRHNFPPTIWGVGKIFLPIFRREIHEYFTRIFRTWDLFHEEQYKVPSTYTTNFLRVKYNIRTELGYRNELSKALQCWCPTNLKNFSKTPQPKNLSISWIAHSTKQEQGCGDSGVPVLMVNYCWLNDDMTV
jgi:hypothetical protein